MLQLLEKLALDLRISWWDVYKHLRKLLKVYLDKFLGELLEESQEEVHLGGNHRNVPLRCLLVFNFGNILLEFVKYLVSNITGR